MADARKLTLQELREIISDGVELAKGAVVYDGRGITYLSRYQNKLFCEAAGSGSAPYKVGITFGDTKEVRGRCSCMAARSRPFCKHAAALLVAWAQAPESFAVSDTAPPDLGGGGAKKKSVKKGDTSAAELMKQGVERVATLVRELGLAGVASMSDERVAQIRALGESLREHKLRRLSARTVELADLLDAAPSGGVPPVAYLDALTDLLLTARKLDKHLSGEPLDDRYVEELVGKTWRKTDRAPVGPLDLVEYAFLKRSTPDGFAITESRFIDLASGAHFSEKQILPAFLVKRTAPKKSWAGRVLEGARGGRYPGFAPARLDLEEPPLVSPLSHTALERLLAVALPQVGKALGVFQDQRKDPFAPSRVPAAVRIDRLLSRTGRAQLVDAEGQALFVPDHPVLEERLAALLREGRLQALLGDVDVDAALPTLWPLAAVVEGPLGLELCPLGNLEDAAAIGSARGGSWAAAARASGASTAAVSLAEIREELADALITGLGNLTPRVTDPLVARLRDLGLEKQAVLLDALARRPDPAERLDDAIKLYQVLEIALVRLLGASHVDRSQLERVPTYESVYILRSSTTLPPAEVGKLRARGELSRYEAAAHYARYYEQLPAEELAANVFPTWADGAASPFVARALALPDAANGDSSPSSPSADRGALAVEAAKRALQKNAGRVARMTALRVLQAVGDPAARALLAEVRTSERDVTLRVLAADALDALEVRAGAGGIVRARRQAVTEKRQWLEAQLAVAPQREERILAIHGLVSLGDQGALPSLRVAFLEDASGEVRELAALALGHLLDVEMVDTFVRMLAARDQNDAAAKTAAYALGFLGDARGLDALLSAWASGWKPSIVGDALRAMGAVALGPLLALIESRPEVAGRKAAIDVLKQVGPDELTAAMVERLDAAQPLTVERATLLLKLAGAHDPTHKQVATRLLALFPDPSEKSEKALRRAAEKALG
jgi:hypothetical protein